MIVEPTRDATAHRPLLSIVTVGFNCAETVGDTLRSIASAFAAVPDRSTVEYVFVDGSSTDATLSIVRSFPHTVDVVIAEPDDGMFDAMNKGAAAAKGCYLWFVNSDDMLESPAALAHVLDGLRKDPEVLYGDILIVDKDDLDRVKRYWRAMKRLSFVQLGWYPPHPGFLIAHDFFDALGGFDLRYTIASDIDFMTRALLRKPRFEYVPETLIRMRAGGASNTSWKAIAHANTECVDSLRRAHVRFPWLVVTLKVLRKAWQRSERLWHAPQPVAAK